MWILHHVIPDLMWVHGCLRIASGNTIGLLAQMLLC